MFLIRRIECKGTVRNVPFVGTRSEITTVLVATISFCGDNRSCYIFLIVVLLLLQSGKVFGKTQATNQAREAFHPPLN